MKIFFRNYWRKFKIQNLEFGILMACFFLLFLFPLSSFAQEDTPFSAIYYRVSSSDLGKEEKSYSEIDLETARRLSAILKISQEQILDFIFHGKYGYGDVQLIDVCYSAQDKKTKVGFVQERIDICFANIHRMWAREWKYVERELLYYEKSMAYARYFDGRLSNKKDFDILTDLNILDKQFYGKLSEPIEVPEPSLLNRQILSLEENGFVLEDHSEGFSVSDGCEEGEVSLYGGIICVPEFCDDYLCVKVKATPGRGAMVVPGQKKEASFQNISYELNELCTDLEQIQGLTPRRITNSPHFPDVIFDFGGMLKPNIIIKKKVPPIFRELAPKGYDIEQTIYETTEDGKIVKKEISKKPPQKSDSKTSNSSKDSDNTKNNESEDNSYSSDDAPRKFLHVQRTAAEFTAEMIKNAQSFGVCKSGNCTSQEYLKFFEFDCELLSARQTDPMSFEDWVQSCSQEFALKQKNQYISNDQFHQQQMLSLKEYFNTEVVRALEDLWTEISAFEDAVGGWNTSVLKEAKKPCDRYLKKRQTPVSTGALENVSLNEGEY